MDIETMMQRLRDTAAELGLPLGKRDKTYNSRLAQELELWAENEGAGEAFHMAAFKAYFVDGKNIAQIPVLSDLAVTVGLSAEAAEDVLNNRLFKDPVDKDWEESQKLGITAVPTFLMKKDRVVGAQSYDLLENFVTMNGAGKHI